MQTFSIPQLLASTVAVQIVVFWLVTPWNHGCATNILEEHAASMFRLAVVRMMI
jgi:hypothetical protein